ncbi:hypothetical protein Ciccas_010573 [Cichlidogyrus casuarinus]|uniref:Uncharacterized protein n=1 Tax=Cichlidogyrus casuarinus TaxID=1844966 RepID=A0ABD2PUB4_9PLAT
MNTMLGLNFYNAELPDTASYADHEPHEIKLALLKQLLSLSQQQQQQQAKPEPSEASSSAPSESIVLRRSVRATFVINDDDCRYKA